MAGTKTRGLIRVHKGLAWVHGPGMILTGILGGLACEQQSLGEKASTLTYRVSHPMHHVEGISHAARGKGVCGTEECNFLVAVPVKSFDSGDSNRDLHTLQVVRGAEYPMIVVRARFRKPAEGSATIHADVTVQFAGQTSEYKDLPFQAVSQVKETRVSGTIPAKLSDFKISPPEF